MRIAVYSDVHANLPALQAFIKDSAERKVRCYEFLGDAVNYGGSPKECIDGIIKLGMVGHVKGIDAYTPFSSIDRKFIEEVYKGSLAGKILLGNNDAACCGLEDPKYFADTARISAKITKDKLLSDWHQKFLRERPMEAPMNICNEFVQKGHADWSVPVRYNHSTPGSLNLEEWHYVKPNTNPEHLKFYFNYFKERIFFVGHSHLPCSFVQIGGEIIPATFPMPTKNYDKAIVNVGAVGQPREGKTQGSYVIIDSVDKTIELIWFDYDVRQAMKDILNAGLPEQNAQRLLYGRTVKKNNLDKTDSGHLHA